MVYHFSVQYSPKAFTLSSTCSFCFKIFLSFIKQVVVLSYAFDPFKTLKGSLKFSFVFQGIL